MGLKLENIKLGGTGSEFSSISSSNRKNLHWKWAFLIFIFPEFFLFLSDFPYFYLRRTFTVYDCRECVAFEGLLFGRGKPVFESSHQLRNRESHVPAPHLAEASREHKARPRPKTHHRRRYHCRNFSFNAIIYLCDDSFRFQCNSWKIKNKISTLVRCPLPWTFLLSGNAW